MSLPKVSVIVPVFNVEEYVESMLLSLQSQRLKDFEVIMIDDGSTDRSPEIIDNFAESDSRFRAFHKENGGVASARNMGIDLASGEYIVFFDPDDIVPDDSLKEMYYKGKKKNADMIIGVNVEMNLGEKLIYMNSQRLAKKDDISPLDKDFFSAWSLCHKMFRREFIKNNDLKIEKLKNAEDGVFTFCALNSNPKITGCNVVAYNYMKRPFWLSPSATQTISKHYMESLFKSHDRILYEAEKLAKSYFDDEESIKKYLEPLFVRFIEGELINGYYRGIHRTKENLTDTLNERLALYRENISEEQWLSICERHMDLEIERGLKSREELCTKPIISCIICDNLKEQELLSTVNSLYNQNFPSFEIIATEKQAAQIKRLGYACDNLVILPFDILGEDSVDDLDSLLKKLKMIRGRYFLIIDEPVMYTKKSLSVMERFLESYNDCLYAAVRIKGTRRGEYFNYIEQAVAFHHMDSPKVSLYNEKLDPFMCNKLFRAEILSKLIVEDNNLSYKGLGLKGMRIFRDPVISNISPHKMNSITGFKRSFIGDIKATSSLVLDAGINKLKRYISRDDVDRIKSLINRSKFWR